MKLSSCCAVVISFLALVVLATAQTSPSSPETTSASVQVSRLIRFSGIAKDETGKPLSGVLGITFALYKDKQGGAPLWLIIYLALEERLQEMKDELKAMGVSADGEEELYVHAAPNPVEGMLRLTELVQERKPVLVVIDPLFRFAKVKDEKAYAETYAALGPLIDLARETDTHVMLTHHSGKLPKTDPIDSPLGSTALAGVVATLIYENRSGEYRTICTVQRIGDNMPETVLLFDKATQVDARRHKGGFRGTRRRAAHS